MPLLNNAQKDSLTLCYTKDTLVPLMEKMRAEYSAYRKPFSVMVIDIDGFKTFNDKYGHVFGDEALKYFSSSLRLNLDDEDSAIVRFGGDEFVIIFPGRTSKEVYRLAVHIENNIKKRPFLFKGREYRISFSGGVASCPHDGLEPEDLIEKGDKAMYFSKRHGGGKITQYANIGTEFIKGLVKSTITVIILAAIAIAAVRIFNIDTTTLSEKLSFLQRPVPVSNSTMSPAPIAKPVSATATSKAAKVYLNSGNSIEGIITDENDKDVTLKFNMATGEGAAVIKKTDIKHINRDYKE